MINENQYAGLLNEIVTFYHDYKIHFMQKKGLKDKLLCELICRDLCEHLWELVEFVDVNEKENVIKKIKSAIDQIINENLNDEECVFEYLTKNKKNEIMNIIDKIALGHTNELVSESELKNKNQIITSLKNMVSELTNEYNESSEHAYFR